MSVADKNDAISSQKKDKVFDDSTDSDNETGQTKHVPRRISTRKCVGRLPVVKEGYLMKQTGSFQRWRQRFFQLRGRTLYFAKDKESQLFEEVELDDVTFAECSIKNVNHSFQIITRSCTLCLSADSREEMSAWSDAVRGARTPSDAADVVARLASGEHEWYAATHARPTFCNVCREALPGVTSHGVSCGVCKLKAHKRCAARAPPQCKWTTLASMRTHIVEDADGTITMPHQWLEGNLPVSAKCAICDRTCGSVLRLQDHRCLWCRRSVHAACRPAWRAACGGAGTSLLLPTHLHSLGADDAWTPPAAPQPHAHNAHHAHSHNLPLPLLVFVNSKSGDNQGVKFLRRFKQLLNPAQVWELGGGRGPRVPLRLYRHYRPLRVLVCSGDGSVSWVLGEIDNLDMHKQCQVGVLPLGTGNDLARVLGWGAACDDAASLPVLLRRYETASTKMLDRWSIMSFERPPAAPLAPSTPPDHETHSTNPTLVAHDEHATHGTDATHAAPSVEEALMYHLQSIVQAATLTEARESARSMCAAVAGAGADNTEGECALRRLRSALTLLLRALREQLQDDDVNGDMDLEDEGSAEESELDESCVESLPEKGIKEKTEKEEWNAARARRAAVSGRADGVRRAVRRILLHRCEDTQLSHPHTDPGDKDKEAISSCNGVARLPMSELPMPAPRAFADGSRRSSAASNVAPLDMEHIPDVDEDLAKLLGSSQQDQTFSDVDIVASVENDKRLSGLSIDTNFMLQNSGSCRNLFRVGEIDEKFGNISIDIPELVVSSGDDFDLDSENIADGEKYESPQMTIIDIDKPYTDDLHFEQLSAMNSRAVTPDFIQNVDEDEILDGLSLNSHEEFSFGSDAEHEPIADMEDDEECELINHIDSPEMSDTTFINSETLHGESMNEDLSSMLGQEILLAMMGKNESETLTDETTLFTSDTVSEIGLDSRNPSLERYDESKLKYLSKFRNPTASADEKFGFENKAFTLETTAIPEQIRYCSLAQFVEGNDIARKSFKKQMKCSMKKKRERDRTGASLKSKLSIDGKTKRRSENRKQGVTSVQMDAEDKSETDQKTLHNQTLIFPNVSVVVEPPSPAHSDDAKNMKMSGCGRISNVLNDMLEREGSDSSISVRSEDMRAATGRGRRCSDNPVMLNSDSDPDYNKFLGCSPAASRRISCGSLFKPGEADRMSTSVSSIWGGDSPASGKANASADTRDKNKKLPIINPLVRLPAWPNVAGQGLISQCLLANADALCAAVSPLMDPDETLLEGFYERAVMNNYFGIGIDAKITLDFHNKREEHPEKCRSRARNYMWYGVLGSKEWLHRTYRHLGQRVQLECDGQRIPLPELQGIVVLNIPSFMGGANFWGGSRADELFLAPSHDDRVLEVVAVFGSAQMAASRIINLQKHRIAQCRAVQINILGSEGVPVQVDGEAWLQPPGCIRIIHKNRAQMLSRSRTLETSLRSWDEMHATRLTGCAEAAWSAGEELPPAENARLLQFIDDVAALVKWVKLWCMGEGGAGGDAAFVCARAVAARLDALQDARGRPLPAVQLRVALAQLVSECRSLCSAAGLSVAAGASEGEGAARVCEAKALLRRVQQQLQACSVRDGRVYLHIDETCKKVDHQSLSHSASGGAGGGGGKVSWLRSRRSVSEASPLSPGPEWGASHVAQWGASHVAQWLAGLDLDEYADSFVKNDVTGRELLTLARRDLKDLGITKVGHVKRILQAVKDIQSARKH